MAANSGWLELHWKVIQVFISLLCVFELSYTSRNFGFSSSCIMLSILTSIDDFFVFLGLFSLLIEEFGK